MVAVLPLVAAVVIAHVVYLATDPTNADESRIAVIAAFSVSGSSVVIHAVRSLMHQAQHPVNPQVIVLRTGTLVSSYGRRALHRLDSLGRELVTQVTPLSIAAITHAAFYRSVSPAVSSAARNASNGSWWTATSGPLVVSVDKPVRRESSGHAEVTSTPEQTITQTPLPPPTSSEMPTLVNTYPGTLKEHSRRSPSETGWTHSLPKDCVSSDICPPKNRTASNTSLEAIQSAVEHGLQMLVSRSPRDWKVDLAIFAAGMIFGLAVSRIASWSRSANREPWAVLTHALPEYWSIEIHGESTNRILDHSCSSTLPTLMETTTAEKADDLPRVEHGSDSLQEIRPGNEINKPAFTDDARARMDAHIPDGCSEDMDASEDFYAGIDLGSGMSLCTIVGGLSVDTPLDNDGDDILASSNPLAESALHSSLSGNEPDSTVSPTSTNDVHVGCSMDLGLGSRVRQLEFQFEHKAPTTDKNDGAQVTCPVFQAFLDELTARCVLARGKEREEKAATNVQVPPAKRRRVLGPAERREEAGPVDASALRIQLDDLSTLDSRTNRAPELESLIRDYGLPLPSILEEEEEACLVLAQPNIDNVEGPQVSHPELEGEAEQEVGAEKMAGTEGSWRKKRRRSKASQAGQMRRAAKWRETKLCESVNE